MKCMCQIQGTKDILCQMQLTALSQFQELFHQRWTKGGLSYLC